MTKWIVGLLLLANLALFGWMRWGSLLTVDADAVTVQPALNADKIKLLALQPASAPSPAASGVPLALSPVAGASAPAVASAVAADSTPVAAEASAMVANCAEWGEFSGDDLLRAQQELDTLKLGDKLTQRSVELDHGYWVYIPPMKKHSQVEKKIAQLKQLGVKDYFVVQEKGRWLNAISLGVFKSNEAAQKFLASLKAKEVEPVKLGIRKSKLKLTVFVMKGLDAGMADKLNTLQKGFPESEFKVSACSN
ncbi:MAG: SPOR domain-containing protein [Nitrosomonadales bacterium]|nr:SPOR domain-containing protein [Nitrosomonadales bacterium]